MNLSPAHRLASLPADQQAAMLAGMPPEDLAALAYAWEFWARPDQLPPPGDWRTWLFLAGRGFGKTRQAPNGYAHKLRPGNVPKWALSAPQRMLCGVSRLKGHPVSWQSHHRTSGPSYEPSTRRVVCPNGCVAHLFSAEEPDRLRGPNLDAAGVTSL